MNAQKVTYSVRIFNSHIFGKDHLVTSFWTYTPQRPWGSPARNKRRNKRKAVAKAYKAACQAN